MWLWQRLFFIVKSLESYFGRDIFGVESRSERLEYLENDLTLNRQILHSIHAALVCSHVDMTLSATSLAVGIYGSSKKLSHMPPPTALGRILVVGFLFCPLSHTSLLFHTTYQSAFDTVRLSTLLQKLSEAKTTQRRRRQRRVRPFFELR